MKVLILLTLIIFPLLSYSQKEKDERLHVIKVESKLVTVYLFDKVNMDPEKKQQLFINEMPFNAVKQAKRSAKEEGLIYRQKVELKQSLISVTGVIVGIMVYDLSTNSIEIMLRVKNTGKWSFIKKYTIIKKHIMYDDQKMEYYIKEDRIEETKLSEEDTQSISDLSP